MKEFSIIASPSEEISFSVNQDVFQRVAIPTEEKVKTGLTFFFKVFMNWNVEYRIDKGL